MLTTITTITTIIITIVFLITTSTNTITMTIIIIITIIISHRVHWCLAIAVAVKAATSYGQICAIGPHVPTHTNQLL